MNKNVLSIVLLTVFLLDMLVLRTYLDPPTLGVQIIFFIGRLMCFVYLAHGFYINIVDEVGWLVD